MANPLAELSKVRLIDLFRAFLQHERGGCGLMQQTLYQVPNAPETVSHIVGLANATRSPRGPRQALVQ